MALTACALARGVTAADEVREGEISEAVQHALMSQPYYTLFDYLSYSLHGTEVTLTGEVVDSSLKQDAARAVQGIDGVSSVINAIEVLPQSSRDNALRLAEYRAIYSDPSLLRYGDSLDPKIRIIVDHGEVTLEGVVAGDGDKRNVGTGCKFRSRNRQSERQPSDPCRSEMRRERRSNQFLMRIEPCAIVLRITRDTSRVSYFQRLPVLNCIRTPLTLPLPYPGPDLSLANLADTTEPAPCAGF